MPIVEINGVPIELEKGTTVLEAAKFLGVNLPTLCHDDGLTAYGACRLCVVEVETGGRTQVVSACTYPIEDGLKVRTHSRRVVGIRRLLIEMYLATCPSSKTIQDIASKWGVSQCRLKVKHEDCVLCGLCVRMCAQQMAAKAIGFVGRGRKRHITTPFDERSEVCRLCGACMYICPVCQARCQGPQEESAVCSACVSSEPPCLVPFDDMKCYMDPCAWCEQETKTKLLAEAKTKQ
jgi:NADH dehydrogenase/NADH:ubiquinone oxidoreductase subunit G